MRIGLFLDNLDEEYQISVYKGIRAEAAALALDLICIQGETLLNYREDSGGKPFPSLEFLSADGILILTSVIGTRTASAPMTALRRVFNIPVVSIGNRLLDYPSIVVKNKESMTLLMEHLIEFHGYRKLLYLGGPAQHPDNLSREHIFRRTINSLGKKFPGLEGKVMNGEFHQTSAMMMLREYMDANPNAPPEVIVAASDNIALGALELLRVRQEPLWSDCPVTGFDDIDQASREIPALTTIRQPLEEMGKLAVKTLWDLMQCKETSQIIHVESELKIRNSCGCKVQWKSRDDANVPDHTDGGTANRSEYNMQNVSLLGQALITVNSPEEMLSPLRFFLTNLAVKTFYLILYPTPLEQIGKKGNLIYQKTGNKEFFTADHPVTVDMTDFFSNTIIIKAVTERTVTHPAIPNPAEFSEPHSWCVYYLRSSKEYLGLIVYEAPDRVHPQMCNAAIFLANTVKRLQIYGDEKEQSLRLEQEVALRTKDLTETYQKLREEVARRTAVEAEVLRISEMERLRFSMDLHDDICQRLAGISMFCKSLINSVSSHSFLPELFDLIDETLIRTRRYAHDSFPMELDALGLKEALSALCHTVTKQSSCGINTGGIHASGKNAGGKNAGGQNACRCVFSWSGPEKSPFSPAHDLNIYRIVQEALQNAVKHAAANQIQVTVHSGRKIFTVTVSDNGVGIPRPNEEEPGPAEMTRYIKGGGLGLRSMRYRAHQLGAEYIFESSEQEGTRVEIRISLKNG
ncbi:MAG: substrate-binding domain-containing protein [Spirochaetaceae bacterium]|jgi:signal transduction histidine kinase/DNA-binding LacI/PurR family transcriptional regulator|nr:substrate-binding domain-containing protein [Spirochaetaceae bacterium]